MTKPRLLPLLVVLALMGTLGMFTAPTASAAALPKIAFNCQFPRDICTVNSDGSGLVRLGQDTDDTFAKADSNPKWSPDGKQIVFARGADLAVMNADGSGLRVVVAGTYGSGSWSPDGSLIAFSASGVLSVVRPDGTGRATLANQVFGGAPAWSPDGRKLAYVRGDQQCVDQSNINSTLMGIYTVNKDGTSVTRVTPAQNFAAGSEVWSFAYPVWTPGSTDPAKIAYEGYRSSLGTSDGKLYCPRSSTQLFINGVAGQHGGHPSFSDAGSLAFHQRDPDGAFRIYAGGTAIAKGVNPSWQRFAKPACSDLLDNDADGKTDYPADPGCTSASDTSERGTQLVRNGGFELDGNADGRPDSWTSNARFTRSSTLKLSGSYAGRHAARDNSSHTIAQTVSGLRAGRAYRLSGSVNIPATSDSFSYTVRIKWRNSTGATIATTTVRRFTAPTSGWAAFAANRAAPAGTTSAQVQLVASNLNAKVYVDRFVLQIA